MRLAPLCAFLLAALLSANTAHAQAGVYTLFTGANLDADSTAPSRIYGPTFGLYANFPTPLLKFGGDVRASFLATSNAHNYYAMVGPRLEADPPLIPLRPYVEALAGGGESVSTAYPKGVLHINYELLAGVDHKLFTILDWRILEYSYTSSIRGGGDLKTKSLSTGLVLRIP